MARRPARPTRGEAPAPRAGPVPRPRRRQAGRAPDRPLKAATAQLPHQLPGSWISDWIVFPPGSSRFDARLAWLPPRAAFGRPNPLSCGFFLPLWARHSRRVAGSARPWGYLSEAGRERRRGVRHLTRTYETHNFIWVSREIVNKPDFTLDILTQNP
ncbi:hypothetical protein TRIP_B120038 [uncultured Desulfatiglans sp.]|uniref:Uncharacterized protein n=1 Tax=Uncultured Desulfatiglans sp. TaxID=1748965 RepID=A0A653A0P4_UNCDX|nr:hypothetical protein TRIP_B120038 [uncultured Desulfatiglans sp.]